MATVISELGFIFKDRSTYLSQANWQTFFGNALPSGFDKNIIYDSLGDFFVLNGAKVYIDGIQAATTEAVQIDLPTEEENACLISFVYDNQENKVELVRAVLSSEWLQEDIARFLYYLATDMKLLSRSIAQVIYGSGAESRYTCLPVGVWAYGGDWWNLSRVITKQGETILADYRLDSNDDGYCTIYGGRKYNIIVESTFSHSAVNLIPTPACSMESSLVYIKNDSGGQVTVKLPLLHNLVTYNYVHNGAWVVGADDISIPLADGDEMVINLSQSNQSDIYTQGGPISTYEVAQNSKAEDPGDVYTKAEANSIFATQADLADKADVSDVYTKTQADLLLADKADVDDVYTKTAADNLLADKADADDVYSKAEVDALISEVPVADNFYTKTETNELLAVKANADDVYAKADTYSKTEADNTFATITDLDQKANANDVYSKTEANGRFAVINSPTFTGAPKAPTAASGTNNTQIATTAFVQTANAGKADLDSPTFSGTPKAPTPEAGDSSTKIATTAFVSNAISENNAKLDIYVNGDTGNDTTGNGSPTAPYKTIQKAIDVAPYDKATIKITPGVYNQNITISEKKLILTGTVNTEIRILGAVQVRDGADVIVLGAFTLVGSASERSALLIRDANFIYREIVDGDILKIFTKITTSVGHAITVLGGKFIASVRSFDPFGNTHSKVQISAESNSYGVYGIAAQNSVVIIDHFDVESLTSSGRPIAGENSMILVREQTGSWPDRNLLENCLSQIHISNN